MASCHLMNRLVLCKARVERVNDKSSGPASSSSSSSSFSWGTQPGQRQSFLVRYQAGVPWAVFLRKGQVEEESATPGPNSSFAPCTWALTSIWQSLNERQLVLCELLGVALTIQEDASVGLYGLRWLDALLRKGARFCMMAAVLLECQAFMIHADVYTATVVHWWIHPGKLCQLKPHTARIVPFAWANYKSSTSQGCMSPETSCWGNYTILFFGGGVESFGLLARLRWQRRKVGLAAAAIVESNPQDFLSLYVG